MKKPRFRRDFSPVFLVAKHLQMLARLAAFLGIFTRKPRNGEGNRRQKGRQNRVDKRYFVAKIQDQTVSAAPRAAASRGTDAFVSFMYTILDTVLFIISDRTRTA